MCIYELFSLIFQQSFDTPESSRSAISSDLKQSINKSSAVDH